MKLLINTSNLSVGGGMQVAMSFINELKDLELDNEYHVFLSLAINNQIDKSIFPSNFSFYLIEKSPASIMTRRKIVGLLNNLEEQIKPDIVFSIFGPTYWKPKNIHLMGFAIPWLINPTSKAFLQLSFFKRLIVKTKIIYQKFHIKENSDFYIVESQDTKNKLIKLNINKNNIEVVGNTVSKLFFDNEFFYYNMPKKDNNEFRFITISHNYAHKNLKIIKDVIPYVKKFNINIRFFVTIDSKSYKLLFNGVEKYVINLGSVQASDCPSIYRQCDALFLPTLLECFSASYPEAMKMQIPILTSNLSFATDICGDAALYFDPLNPKDIAEKIKLLIDNKSLQKDLIEKGTKRLQTFETAKSRAEKYLLICEKLALKEIK